VIDTDVDANPDGINVVVVVIDASADEIDELVTDPGANPDGIEVVDVDVGVDAKPV
jgi:hypothetical protein